MLLACGSRHQFQIPPTTAGGVICHPVHLSQNAYIISQGDGHRNIGPPADYNTGIGNINPALIGNPQRIPAREIQPRRPYLVIRGGSCQGAYGSRCPNGSIVATPGMWSVTRRSMPEGYPIGATAAERADDSSQILDDWVKEQSND